MAKSSGIGGQAVIEGVMMRNGERYSVAIRTPDKKIEVIEKDYNSSAKRFPFLNIFLIRGVAAFVDSLRVGLSVLNYSSSFYEEDEEDKLSEVAGKVFKEKAEGVITAVSLLISFVLAIGLFVMLPYWVSRLFVRWTEKTLILNLVEGLTRLLIFVIYVLLISNIKDIKRVFMYHGAEHKSINCIENGYPLTPENVRRSSIYHKRCGTSFMVFVMIISIILFIFIQTRYRWLNLLLRVLLVPLIAGISYEILKFAGNHSGIVVDILSAPGVLMQKLTVKEPDESMIEVAIAAVNKVFDWEAYLTRREDEIEKEKARKKSTAIVLDTIGDEDEDEEDLAPVSIKEENEGMFKPFDDLSELEFVDLDDINNINDIDDIFEKDQQTYVNVAEYVEEIERPKSKKRYKKKKR